MRSKHLLCVIAARDHTLVLRENVLCGWLELLTIRDRGIRPGCVWCPSFHNRLSAFNRKPMNGFGV